MLRITPPHAPEAPNAAPSVKGPVAGRSPAGDLPAAEPALAASAAPNPSLRMDPELGLVVLEFRSVGDDATVTIPTSRELDAYRRAARTGAPSPLTQRG